MTMARVNRLFGVTMPEQGVSQLVSVDLEKAIEIATILAKTGDDYRIISLPKKKDPFAELAIKLGEGASISDIVMQKIGLQTKLTNPIEDLLKADKIQARIPFIMELK